MSHTHNVLSDATVLLNEGSVGGWTVDENAVAEVALHFSPYMETLGGTTPLASLKVRAVMGGDASVQTEKGAVEAGYSYKASIWVGGSSNDGILTIRYYNIVNELLTSASTSFEALDGFWRQVPIIEPAPIDAAFADILVTFQDSLPNEEFFISYPTISQYNFELGLFAEYVELNIPDFMVEADRSIDDQPSRPLLRFIDVATYQLADILDTVIDFDYVRATDSITGEPSYSSLTDPAQAELGWLSWLAQQVGVTLRASGSGFTNWNSFEEVGIDTWDEWEQSIVPGGSGADTDWNAIETFDAVALESLDGFRDQIRTGYGGVMSSNVNSISQYTKTLLTGTTANPYVFVRKHYRTNPWRLAVVIRESENPDPGGNGLEDMIINTAPAGTIFDVLSGVQHSASVLFDASEMFANMSPDIDGGPLHLPATGGPVIKFLEDLMGTNRHLILFDSDDIFVGGGVSRSRYFAVADNSGEHFTGFGLMSGFTQATSASHAALNILGDIDVRVLISDLHPVAGTSRVLVASANKWRLLIDEDCHLAFEWQDSGTEVESSTVPLNYLDYQPYWVRATLDVDPGVVRFYTASDLYGGWNELGASVSLAGTTAIDSNATNAITVYEDDTTPTSALGAVYRAIVLDGIDGTEVFDLNFLDISNADIVTGVDTFAESGPHTLAVNVTGATSAAGAYVPSHWIAHKHEGVDYFYFGASPFLSGGDPSLGDTLTVSGLDSANHDYLVTYLDGTNASANLGTATSHVLDSDDTDFGGKAITSISIKNTTGGAEVGLFTPELLLEDPMLDSYGRTWVLTRLFSAGEDGYETSSLVARSIFEPVDGPGIIRYGGYGHGASVGTFDYTAQSVSMGYRRFWETSPSPVIMINNMITVDGADYGWQIGLDDDLLYVVASDGVIRHTLSWDEATAERIGIFNNFVVNFSGLTDRIELWVNGALVDQTSGFFPRQFLTLGGTSNDFASIADEASLDLSGDIEIWVGINSSDYIDAALTSDYKVLAEKAGAWTLGFNQETGEIRFQWVDGGTTSFVTATPAPFVDNQPIWIGVKFDADNGAAGHDVEIFTARDLGGEQTLLDSDTSAGVVSIDNSANPITIGASTTMEPFGGHVYGFVLRSVLDGPDLVNVNFSNVANWETTSTSGDDDTGDYVVTLTGQATVWRDDLVENQPEFSPTEMRINEGSDLGFQFSQLAIYDHVLDWVAIEGLSEVVGFQGEGIDT